VRQLNPVYIAASYRLHTGCEMGQATTTMPTLQLLFFHCIDSLFKTVAFFEMGLKARKGPGGKRLDIGILRIFRSVLQGLDGILMRVKRDVAGISPY